MILPLFTVSLPPSTDLPQLIAQVELLGQALDSGAGAKALQDPPPGEGAFRIQAWHPNKLGYLPILAGWAVGGPLGAGRWAMALVAASWVAALGLAAHSRKRPPGSIALASLFFYSAAWHWGFVNFLVGFPVFLIAWLWAESPRGQASSPLPLAALSLLLYSAHVLWLAALSAVLLATSAWRRHGNEAARRCVALAPAWCLVVLWFVGFRQSGVDSRVFWGQLPWQRLHPTWIVESLFGGLQGLMEPALAAVALGWIGAGLWQNRRSLGPLPALETRPEAGAADQEPENDPGARVDRGLLAVALLLLGLAFLLPGVYHHTILFAARWLAPGLVLAALAVPPPRLQPALRAVVPCLLLALLASDLAKTWRAYEAEELRGFPEALEVLALEVLARETPKSGPSGDRPSGDASVPSDLRLLGLDFVRSSPRLDSFPYHHLPAYAQATTGIQLNRSFADDAASLVVFDPLPHNAPWTDRLDWKPEKLRASDFDFFDFLLAHGSDALHARFRQDPRLIPLGVGDLQNAPWRLYRILQRPKNPAASSEAE